MNCATYTQCTNSHSSCAPIEIALPCCQTLNFQVCDCHTRQENYLMMSCWYCYEGTAAARMKLLLVLFLVDNILARGGLLGD